MEAGQQVTDVGTLMEEEGAFRCVPNDCHAKDAHRASEVFDVKCSSERDQELARPRGIAAEDEDIIDVDGDVDHQGGSNERLTGVVALELVKAIVSQKTV